MTMAWSKQGAGMPIPQGEQYCVRCLEKGHNCVAQTTDAEDRPVCVFCADGEPCPIERREAREHKHEPVQLPAKPETESATEKEAMLEQGEIAAKQCKCGAELNAKNRSGLCNKCYGKRWYQLKKAKQPAAEPKAKKTKKAKAKRARREFLTVNMRREAEQISKGISRAVSEALAPAPRDSGQLTVNQAQLARMIAALPSADQLAMVNDWLSRQA